MKQQLFLLVFILILPLKIIAADAPKLNHLSFIGVGAKATALKGAFSSIADDYSAPFWNPAGIGFINSVCIGGMHHQMSLNRTIDFFSVVIPGSYNSAYGFGWLSFKINDIEARQKNSFEPDYIFNSNDQLIYLTYGKRIWGRCSIGVNAKFFYDRLGDTRAYGGAMDAGLMLQLFRNIKISLVSQDLIANVKWDTGNHEKYNPLYKTGISFTIKNLLITSEYRKYGNSESWIFGAETKLMGVLKLRSGIGADQWAVGTGISVPVWSKTILLVNYTLLNDPFNVEFSQIVDFNIQIF